MSGLHLDVAEVASWWPAALLVAIGVVAVVRARRSPLRRLRPASSGQATARHGTPSAAHSRPVPGAGSDRRSAGITGVRERLAVMAVAEPRRLIVLGAVTAAGLGFVLGGPVAAIVGGIYAAVLVRMVLRRLGRKRAAAARSRSLDDLGALAADLRAGLPPAAVRSALVPSPSAPPGVTSVPPSGQRRIAELTAAVWRLAERTGAPAADLVERIEADARAADRAAASAVAQAAGAHMTAVLLAALPLGGIGLGYLIGADPLQVLLHTKAGAACAVAAVLLQVAGLTWCDRLVAR